MRNMTTLAEYYYVEDINSALAPATRLRNILESLEQGRLISVLNLDYLQTLGLYALQQFAQNEQPYEVFADCAKLEQWERLAKATEAKQAEFERLAKAAEAKQAEFERLIKVAKVEQVEFERLAKAAEAEQAEFERLIKAAKADPKYISRMKNKQLCSKYGIHVSIQPEDFPHMMTILESLDCGKRLSDDDSLWLKTSGKDYFSHELQLAFHQREAEYFVAEYKRTGDPWNAVNASSHYRKCESPEKAHDLLISIPLQKLKAAKLQSAIATTHGGVKRDMNDFNEALLLGAKAHSITPRNFRPCTLLGAVNFELGNYEEGRNWYAKAVERGATERDVDHDLRGILLRASKVKRQEIARFLIAEDAIRFQWVNKFLGQKSSVEI